MNQITKGGWIDKVYALLCKSQGQPCNDSEKRNLREWAETMADYENNWSTMTPKEAHAEELSSL